MHDVRRAMVQAVEATIPLFASGALSTRWEEPSVLPHFSVRGLAGHLLRAPTVVEAYLDGPPPPARAPLITAAAYYVDALSDSDIEGDAHTLVRARGEEAAAGGPSVVAGEWEAACERLRSRLATEPPNRRVQVYRNHVLLLDEYLRTRLVELCVHADDLAASLGVAPPALPEAATEVAIATLVEVARQRRGDLAVLRALTRRERDDVEALRVM